MIYAISDIHGNLSQLIRRMEQLEKIASFSSGKDMLIFLGDYINRGEHSYQVLEYVRNLSSRSQGNIVPLRGNHEDAFLDFIDGLDVWLTDMDLLTVRTFLSLEEQEYLETLALSSKMRDACRYARSCIKKRHMSLLSWLRELRYFYATDKQIFVHAGVHEDAMENWPWGTPDYIFVQKHPPTTGSFILDVIAGHTSARSVSGDPTHEGIYWDGQSHYFIDGCVDQGGSLLCLAYDEKSGKYYELLPPERIPLIQEQTGTISDQLKPL